MAEIKVPSLGESVTEATVAQWLKKEGEAVKADEPIVELETDKVTLEVNAPEDGVISSIVIQEGEDVEVGAILGEIEAGAAANDSTAKSEAPAETDEEESSTSQATEAQSSDKDASGELSPAVRKILDDNNLQASQIQGTGKDGRLLKADVQAYLDKQGAASSSASASPSSAPAPSAPPVQNTAPQDTGPREERVRMTKLRKVIASRLKEAQNTAAMLTTFNEVDMGAVMDARKDYKDAFEKKHGVKLGFMSFFIKACVNALKEFPAINAEISGDDIVYKNYYDISVAVSTPQGLIVPVIRDCEHKSMADVEKTIVDLGTRAKQGTIGMDELQGGTFTITNGGIFGSLNSTPILNAPQSGILGMHKIQQRPVVMPDGSIEARPMMYLALSYDHRIVDGREAVSFLVRVKDAIEDPKRLVLDI